MADTNGSANGPWYRSLVDLVLRQGVGWALLAFVVLWLTRSVDEKLTAIQGVQTQTLQQLKDNAAADAKDRAVLIRLQQLQCKFNTEGHARDLCDEIAQSGGHP